MESEELQKIKKEFERISKELLSGELIKDPKKLQKNSKRHSELKEILDIADNLKAITKEIDEVKNIYSKEKDEDLKNLALEELEKKELEKERVSLILEEKLYPEPGSDIKEAIVEIRAGVGGDEAALFAHELFRMYSKYADIKKWKLSLIDESKNDLGGIKEITFEILGDKVYSALKNESGVHRVQRVPETEKSGRLHTSSASVAVLPKAKEVDIEIKSEDVKMETFRSSGPGGQNVNKVETAVRVTHLPTGMTVASQIHKRQSQNREAAMTLLRSRLLKAKQEEEIKKIKKERKQQIGSGDRSEKIRTYNYPQDRITDHRIPKSWHGIDKILDGYLDEIIEEVRKGLK